MDDTKLVVVQSADQRTAVSSPEEMVIVIDELLADVPVSRYDDIYGQFREASLPDIAGVPLYRVIWQRFAVPFNGFPDQPSGLTHLIVLYEELDKLDCLANLETVDCYGLEPSYQALLADFAEAHGIETAFSVDARRHRLLGFLRGLVSLLLVFFDSILSLLLRQLYDFKTEAEVVFVPHLNRFDAIKPVLNAAEYDYIVVAPVSTVEWIYHRLRGRWEDSAQFSPVPVGAYTSITVIFKELELFVRLSVAELLFGEFKQRVTTLVHSEFGIPLDRAVSLSLGNTYPTNIGPLPNLWLASEMYQTTGASAVVVGSLSLRQQLFLVAADQSGLSSFHVPHTVPTHYDTVPKTDTVHFVPSESARDYHEQSEFLWNDSTSVVPVGRPLLSSLASDRSPSQPVTEPIRVVIATQPFDDNIRREFVSAVVDRVRDSPHEFSIVIKTHPIENQEFYADFETACDNLHVVDSDLYGELDQADLTFVVNTNVGLESIALGTPIVAVNFWEPFTNSRPYQEREPIPLLRSQEELASFVGSFDPDGIEDLRNEQMVFFDEQYFGAADVPTEIAEYIHNPTLADDRREDTPHV